MNTKSWLPSAKGNSRPVARRASTPRTRSLRIASAFGFTSTPAVRSAPRISATHRRFAPTLQPTSSALSTSSLARSSVQKASRPWAASMFRSTYSSPNSPAQSGLEARRFVRSRHHGPASFARPTSHELFVVSERPERIEPLRRSRGDDDVPQQRYCTRCVYPSRGRGAATFDDEGVCTGCRVHEQSSASTGRRGARSCARSSTSTAPGTAPTTTASSRSPAARTATTRPTWSRRCSG